jgi:superfamily II DNA/RNA helicase
MSLSKLREELQEILPDKGISELNEFQLKILDALKSGKNILAEGHEGAGKTTAILVSLLQKIEEPSEGSPRAIVICSTDQKAYDLHASMEKICRILDLTVDLAHDRGNILQQRNDIFDGTEIIIGNAKRLYELYIQNGFNVSKLKLFILDDAIDLFKNGYKMQISRIVESLPKCQHMLFSTSFKDRRVEDYLEEFVPVAMNIDADQ